MHFIVFVFLFLRELLEKKNVSAEKSIKVFHWKKKGGIWEKVVVFDSKNNSVRLG